MEKMPFDYIDWSTGDRGCCLKRWMEVAWKGGPHFADRQPRLLVFSAASILDCPVRKMCSSGKNNAEVKMHIQGPFSGSTCLLIKYFGNKTLF